MKSRILSGSLLSSVLLFACSGSVLDGGANRDGGAAQAGTANQAGGANSGGANSGGANSATGSSACCARDVKQSGCMNLGGPASSGCVTSCDFWCSTNWRVERDSSGCEVWRYNVRSPQPGEDAHCLASSVPNCDCISQTISWGLQGGRWLYEATSFLNACRRYRYERTSHDPAAPKQQCSQDVTGCGMKGRFDAVVNALQTEDVQAARKLAPVTYGQDQRDTDLPLFELTIDGATIRLGTSCTDPRHPECVPVPPGLATLEHALVELESEQLQLGECRAQFPEP